MSQPGTPNTSPPAWSPRWRKLPRWLARAQQALLRLCLLALVFAALGLALATYAQQQNHWLGQSLTWWRELSFALHACLLFFTAMALLGQDGHLRIDLFYSRLSPARRLPLERLFALLLALPLMGLLLATALPWAWLAWSRLEASANPSGMAGIYVVKLLLVLAAGQGVSLSLLRLIAPRVQSRS